MISSPVLLDSMLERAGRLSLNLRLHPNELAFIANHAEDCVLIVDDTLLHLFDRIRPKVHCDGVFVVDHGCREICQNYEEFILENSDEPGYPEKVDAVPHPK